jgi:AcrR family transcriptional regulator
MAVRLGRPNETRPSLRQLAAAAEVTVPTLRHYFGGRDEIVEAVLVRYRKLGEPFMREVAAPHGPFDESVRQFLHALTAGMERGRIADIFAMGFIEGLLNDRLGPACLQEVVDPAVDALTERLEAHQRLGEMKPGDARHAALMLIAPVLVGWHHQEQMFGRAIRPLDVPAFVDDLATAFVAAYRP